MTQHANHMRLVDSTDDWDIHTVEGYDDYPGGKAVHVAYRADISEPKRAELMQFIKDECGADRLVESDAVWFDQSEHSRIYGDLTVELYTIDEVPQQSRLQAVA